MTPQQSIAITEMSQTGSVRRSAEALAGKVGLSVQETGRLGLVVTEAATNLVKHARGGQIVLRPLVEGGTAGIEVVAMDHGPGIQDIERAVRDGYSTSGSMGSGLGAIVRLATSFDIYSSDTGTIIVARVGGIRDPQFPVDIGVLCLPLAGEPRSGDGWSVDHTSDRTKVLVVDGLGHGPEAHEAAAVASEAFTRHATLPPAELLNRIHEAMRPTRGGAGAILELDREKRVARFVGVGNVSASILGGGPARSLVSHHGVLGHNVRKIQEFQHPWPERSLVVLHTDGISTRWALDRYPGLEGRRPCLVAAALYRDYHRERDDATVLALREAA